MVRLFLLPVILLTALALGGCQVDVGNNSQNDVAATNLTEPPAPEPPALPTVEAPLTRRDVLLATIEAASDFATGVDDRERQRALDGRPFSFRMRLCGTGGPLGQSSFDAEERVLRVEVRPTITAESPVVQPLLGERFEAVEGFWVPRPWLLQAGCPRTAPAPAPAGAEAEASEEAEQSPSREQAEPPVATVPASTVGLAEFFEPSSDRSQRREGRPYTLTRKLGENVQPGPVDLVLSGRLSRLPEGKVITCTSLQPAGPPTCIVSVRVDTVRLEDPSGALLAEWTGA